MKYKNKLTGEIYNKEDVLVQTKLNLWVKIDELYIPIPLKNIEVIS